MAVYKAPLKDIQFVLNEVLDVSSLATLPGYEDATPDTIQAILQEAAKLCENVLFPLNRSGDEEGCTYENGVVRTPKGFKEAYQQFREGGWTATTCDPAYGGQGLPATVGFAITEMITAANQSFGMYPGLSHGAYEALSAHGSEELKKLYLPKLTDGTWSGTMCLTEPQCGTDLGLIRTRAEPQADGSYAITGTKIFISAGEHDLTENIVHLVLARLPDAPGGTKGISLFLVPKFVPTPEGEVGERNGIRCGAIEHKMGIKASSTCVMNLDGAKGWLVGEPNKGMPAMFVMMNAARLGVGMQGLGIAECAYQSAVAYARDRLQGRALTGPKNASGPADPIIVHPDVRRMLMTQKSFTEGARALALWVGMLIDRAHRHSDEKEREAADDLIQMLTPVIKAYFTDMGSECANLAVQTYGGHGFIRENGVEQLVRDARITQLYEGTNGIQALDLVGRKLPMKGGRAAQRLLGEISGFIAANKSDDRMKEFVEPLEKALGRVQDAALFLMQNAMKNPDEAGAAATDLLRLMALTAMAFMWNRIVVAAHKGLANGGDKAFYEAKLATARFYMARVLPQTTSLNHQIKAGAATVMALPAEAF
ncbi:acyl-CoA dehydrogenase C-terminal domain-containing protein [Enhydrobacter sp.]|jgi:alkylation response protein AidB-like acyl-CoA dehydrogenase|uniref:acyl-CoA dehydrogenase C-terminal domain-containing protein n=1 Tax=Enhydrobacter sp. TaxID=1894999 RepID=UPI00260595FB|nr:acyl-CoA dehydrogenase C-terminal domain-containing protein [Enhydrobacter sp.]WIM13044.1 MAG: Long chain acyl-CoA dehydrogenase [fadN-fadA-fadE operon] [Enhydrobacter sp.]